MCLEFGSALEPVRVCVGARRSLRRALARRVQMAGGSDDKSETAVAVVEQLSQLSAKFERLEAAVQRLAEERPADQRQLEDIDIAGRRHVDNEQRAVSQSAVALSYSELQSEFRAIKDCGENQAAHRPRSG